uniref:Putative alpha-d-galactosidase melibiase n=1 Tax=Ixodes ricinus TaxID=34613 RepID=A0A0K8RL50_IXORI
MSTSQSANVWAYNVQVAVTARVTGARVGAHVSVDAELEPPGVHEVCEVLDAAGEPDRIGLETAVGVTVKGGPAVVDVHVHVPSVPVPFGHQDLRHLFEEPLAYAVFGITSAVDVALESFPGEPSHRRCPGESVLETRNRQSQPQGRKEDQHSRSIKPPAEPNVRAP